MLPGVNSTQPYSDVNDHVRDELRRVWLRVEYQIRLSWKKGGESVLGDGAAIGPAEMGRLFATARGEIAADAEDSGAELVLEQWLQQHNLTEARIRATIDGNVPSALVTVRRRPRPS